MNDVARKVEFRADAAGRLDKLLVARLPEFSRARIQALIREGLVWVGGKTAQKSGHAVDAGQLVEITIPQARPSGLEPENIPLQVIYEDGDILVIDKPAGMVVHPAAGHAAGTLANAALAHAPEMEGIGGEQRPGIVHRLDKNTSGLLVIAKNERAHRWLVDQFKSRHVEKTYLALVDGAPPTPQGRVEAPVGRSPANRQMMAVVSEAKGRPSVSEYKTRKSFEHHTLLEVHPLTGRTHQIRVHMAFLGCPVAGDTIYGHRKSSIPIDRHFLHAARLKIVLPDGLTEKVFEAPLPEPLEEVLSNLV